MGEEPSKTCIQVTCGKENLNKQWYNMSWYFVMYGPLNAELGYIKVGRKKRKKKGSMVGHIAVYTILGNCQALDGPNNLSTSFSHLWLGQWAILVPTLGGQSPFPHLISYPNA